MIDQRRDPKFFTGPFSAAGVSPVDLSWANSATSDLLSPPNYQLDQVLPALHGHTLEATLNKPTSRLERADRTQKPPGAPAVSEISREEIAARFEASEAKVEARLAGIEAQIAILVAKTDQSIDIGKDARDAAREARSATVGTRWAVIGTAITLVAIVFGVWGLVFQSMDFIAGLKP